VRGAVGGFAGVISHQFAVGSLFRLKLFRLKTVRARLAPVVGRWQISGVGWVECSETHRLAVRGARCGGWGASEIFVD
jgi:hypothetical protein